MLTCVYQQQPAPLAKNCLVRLDQDSKKVIVSRYSGGKGGQVKVELVKNKNLNSFIQSQPNRNHPFCKKSPGRAKRTWSRSDSNNNNSSGSGGSTSSGYTSLSAHHKSTSLWSSFDSDDASGSSGSTCDNSNSEWESAYSSDSEPVRTKKYTYL